MCMIDDCEPCDVYHARVRKARRSHRCAECGRTIEPGETYRYVAMLYDGYWDDAKSCAHCRVAEEWLTKECGGFLHHGVLEDIEEHASEPVYGFAVRLLAIGMRRGWRRRDGAMWPVPALPKLSAPKVAATSPEVPW